MTSHLIRKICGYLTQKQFSEKYNIPLATVKNWDARDCMPEYIENLILTTGNEEYEKGYKNGYQSATNYYCHISPARKETIENDYEKKEVN